MKRMSRGNGHSFSQLELWKAQLKKDGIDPRDKVIFDAERDQEEDQQERFRKYFARLGHFGFGK